MEQDLTAVLIEYQYGYISMGLGTIQILLEVERLVK